MIDQRLNEEILKAEKLFAKLYGQSRVESAKDRYRRIISRYYENFSSFPRLYSAPGRIEIIGNHTDHNNGYVLTTSVNVDAVAAAAPNGTDRINVISEGYAKEFQVDVNMFMPIEDEKSTTKAIIRGVLGYFANNGLQYGGFDAYISSDVPGGSGLSSSASFELLIGTILSDLFNDRRIPSATLALAGQYAENIYAGKPSGLLDQMGSAWGGIISIDFASPKDPVTIPVDVDFVKSGYSPVIVYPGGGHEDLTSEYAAITVEMHDVAAFFGKDKLRSVEEGDFYAALPKLYKAVKNRAVLRAIHYYNENKRVLEAVNALKNNDFDCFLKTVTESGKSSWMYLQNCYLGQDQNSCVALALCEKLLDGKGAFRVHGGGFGGGILTFVPNDMLEIFTNGMDAVFGEGAAVVMHVRPIGACRIF